MYTYSEKQIKSIIDILNGITVQGIQNMSSIIQIVQIINDPEEVRKEED